MSRLSLRLVQMGMRSLVLLLGAMACGPRNAPPKAVPEAEALPSSGCPASGRLYGRVLDTNSREALSLATVVATSADGTREVAITNEYGAYCIDTDAVDVQLDVYFGDVAVQQLVHLADEEPVATDILLEAYPVAQVVKQRRVDSWPGRTIFPRDLNPDW